MRLVYINQQGVLGNYVKELKRKATTGFKRVQDVNTALNQTVEMYSSLEATEDNSRELWEALDSIFRKGTAKMTRNEVECEAYAEIEKWMNDVGDNIAWGSMRHGITQRYINQYIALFLYSKEENEDFVECFLRALTCITSMFKSRANADSLFAQVDKASEEELMSMAKKWHDDMLSKYRQQMYSEIG